MPARKVAERQAQAADAHLSADDMYEQGMAAAKRMAVASPAQPAPKEGAVTRTVVRQWKHSRHYHERAPLPVGASPGVPTVQLSRNHHGHEYHALVLCLCIQPGRPTRYHLLDQYLFCPVASFKVRMFMPISEAGSMSSAGCHLLFSGIKISLSGHPKLTSHGQTSIARAAGHTGNVDWEAIYGTAKPADRCGADDTSSECAAVWPGQLYGAEPYPTAPSSSKGPPEPDAGVRTLEKSEFLPSSNLPNRLSYDVFIADLLMQSVSRIALLQPVLPCTTPTELKISDRPVNNNKSYTDKEMCVSATNPQDCSGYTVACTELHR